VSGLRLFIRLNGRFASKRLFILLTLIFPASVFERLIMLRYGGRMLKVAAAITLSAPPLGAIANPPSLIPFPAGYRSWAHVKSAINEPSHPQFGRFSGMYHIYANRRALEGYRTGRFPDGSVLVFDLRKSRTENHVTQAAGRHFIDVMVRNRQKYKETGGWGYEEFWDGNPENRTVSTGRREMMCHSCHKSQAARDFVFSSISD
jgi:hypothetical protein